jgi:3-oxoadipate enol-lactonase
MGSDLHSEITGEEGAPVIVFSHALGGDLTMWDRQVPQLIDKYRVLRYDLRGHGRSAQQAESFGLADLARDVLELIDQHGIQQAHFCGLSLGGMIGQWLGMHAGNRLLSLVLVDTAPQMGSPEQWKERIEKIEQGGMSAISDPTMTRWFTEQFRKREPEVVGHFKSVLEATSPAGYILCAKVVRDASAAEPDLERYASIDAPTLVVTGSFDTAAKPAECRAMASRIPKSSYVELTAAHISPVEASEDFTRALNDFLESGSG